MEVFGLMFAVSFLVLLTTFVVLHICKRIDKSKGIVGNEIEALVEKSYFETTSDVATKWRLTIPKHKNTYQSS